MTARKVPIGTGIPGTKPSPPPAPPDSRDVTIMRLRVRVAELERERDELVRKGESLCRAQGNTLMRSAAAEANVREAREALDHLLREFVAWNPNLTGLARFRAERLLARPASDDALRAFAERVAAKAWHAGQSWAPFDPEGVVTRVLGDATKGAIEGGA